MATKVILTLDCTGQYGITGKNGEAIHEVDEALAERMQRSGHARIATMWDAAAADPAPKTPVTKTTNKK